MLNKSLVSVIIPCYNSEKYLASTIESVISQTYKNIEIIVIDDGSTDRSVEIVLGFKLPNIKLLKQSNLGACVARNLGFKESKGDFIQYLDADDILSRDKINSQMELVQLYGEGNVYSCGCSNFNNTIEEAKLIAQEIDKSYSNSRNWLIDSWSGKGFGALLNWLTPRRIHENAGEWNESLWKNQDGEFFCRVLLNSKSVYFSGKGMTYYRRNSDATLSKSKSLRSVESVLYSLYLYEKHVLAVGDIRFDRAIAKLYYDFISANYPLFPDLIKEANNSIIRLGYKYEDFTNNKIKHFLIRTLGLNFTLYFTYLNKKYIKMKI